MNNNNKNKGMGSLGAALTGAAIGAAAVFLSEEKNRKKIKSTIDSIRENGKDKINQLEKKADSLEKTGRKKLVKKLDQAKQRVEQE